jgi:hypothetical protein
MNKLRTTYGAAEFKGKHGAYDGHKSLFTSGPLNFSNQQEYPVFLHGERLASLKYDSLSQPLDTTSVTVLNKVFLIRQGSFVSSARKGSIKKEPQDIVQDLLVLEKLCSCKPCSSGRHSTCKTVFLCTKKLKHSVSS